ncbi:MAG: HlyD family type I secretion periplasmic adaptor subunit, partial [Alphaproteobacteria bacterium]
SERAAFAARRTELETKVQGRRELVRQRELAIKELESNRKALANDLELALKNLAMSEDLLRDGLTSKMEHVERERDIARISGEIESLRSSIARARAALAEAAEQLREEKQRFQREAFETLNKVEFDIARTRELLSAATTQASRQVIHSPIDGIVKNLLYHTIGGVVRPGEAIMELVPMDENLVFEVRLNPADRGYVALGQRALAKVTSYDVVRYGGLEGTIVNVGADSTVDEDGTPFFKVTVKPARTYLGESPGELPITPGMLATVDIKTGTRTVLEYLLKPVVRLRDEAFRER